MLPTAFGGVRKVRWPWLQPYLPELRRVALIGGVGLLVIQLIPYGRSHVNMTIGPPIAAAAATCQTVFPPGSESAMQLGDFKARIASATVSLNAVMQGLSSTDPAAYRTPYAQFAQAYRGFALELAELYPGRCPRLNANAVTADQAMYSATPSSAAPALYALNIGLFNLSQELDTRIRLEGPEQFVGLETPESEQIEITGTPVWDSDRTRQLATRACASCHSNQPNLPWYTNVAPISWLAQYEVDKGRSVLNLSEWDVPQVAGASQAAASVQRGSMPPSWANGLTGQPQLTDAERAELVRGLLATLNGVR
jgi:mono/diheme cytochrome c family protein